MIQDDEDITLVYSRRRDIGLAIVGRWTGTYLRTVHQVRAVFVLIIRLEADIPHVTIKEFVDYMMGDQCKNERLKKITCYFIFFPCNV